MNERIRELAEQADDYERKLGKGIGPTRDEKFAELIVRECADVAAEHGALDIYEEIREHFGVEE
jgi:hypothetical protein